MSTISLRLPDSLHESVRNLAKEDNISINQFVATALAEKMSALITEKYLSERAEKGNVNHYIRRFVSLRVIYNGKLAWR